MRFTDNYPVIPNLIAVAGLFWITFAFAHSTSTTASQERGALVETAHTVAEPGILMKQVFRLREICRNWFPQEVRSIVGELYRNPALYLVVPFLLFLEFLFPAILHSRLLAKGFCRTPFGLSRLLRSES
jgi:hypothetical protein